MRPLRLKIRGLRSYRDEREVDFSNVGLLAIVGDTGAGKSSILEAITYALYNATTWDARAVKQLISDGAQTATVELEFLAEERTYRITRSTSRGQYPPSVHLLECITGQDVPRLDGEESVNAEVVRLVGLDWKAFSSAVILPQGRFQTLLQATAGDRTAILKGIFRLDELATVRESADQLVRRLRPSLEELMLARAKLLPDPEASAKEAKKRGAVTEKRERDVRKLQTKYRTMQEEARTADALCVQLESAVGRITGSLTGAAGELNNLMSLSIELEGKRDRLKEEEQGARERESRLQTELGAREERGEGLAEIARAQSSLAHLVRDLPAMETERQRLTSEEKQIATSEKDLDQTAVDAQELERKAAHAEKQQSDAALKVRDAQERLANGRNYLGEYREAVALRTDISQRVEQLKSDLGRRKVELDRELTNAGALDQARDDANAALEAVRRGHSAAHAAEGLGLGDPCPICSRPVPDGFVAPPSPDLEPARKAYATAEEEARLAHQGVASARAELSHAEQAIAKEELSLTQADDTLDQAGKHLSGLLPSGDFSSSDDLLLGALVRTVETAIGEHKETEEIAKRVRSASDRADADLAAQRVGLQRRKQDLETAKTRLGEQLTRCESEREGLPERFRPVSPLKLQTLTRLYNEALAEANNLQKLQTDLTEARGQLREIGQNLKEFDVLWNEKIGTPRRCAEDTLMVLLQRITDLTSQREQTVAAHPRELSLDEAGSWAARLEEQAAKLVAELTRRREEASEASNVAREGGRSLLSDASLADEAGLESALIEAASHVKHANADLQLAREQILEAADLSSRISQGQEFIGVLDELTRLLTDGRFIGHMVTHKQRALLAVASDIFAEITGSRYGFAEDFQIVDRVSGQPRSTKTLSGGETFLASLALALGLVELATRSGGRLDALFLDEGFGSLDAYALDEALVELERRATAGRLVAVVSHLRAIAERIETVLKVTKAPGGSEIRWITAADREELVEKELEEGLVS